MVMNLIADRGIDRYDAGELFCIGLFFAGPVFVGGIEGIIIMLLAFIGGTAMDVMSK